MRASTLKVTQAVVTMVATIAVPVVLGVVGWQVQSKIAQQAVQKDFVQMALGIVTKPPVQGEERLREWAVEVLDKNAPVPFTKSLRTDLIAGNVAGGKVIAPALLQMIASTEMLKYEPQPWLELPRRADGSYDTRGMPENYGENYKRAEGNRITLEALREIIMDGARQEAEYLATPAEVSAHIQGLKQQADESEAKLKALEKSR